MALDFPTSSNIIFITDLTSGIDFALATSASGMNINRSFQFEKTIADMTQAEKDAITTLKSGMEGYAKTDCESDGFIFN